MGALTYAAVFYDTHEPPIAVAIVEENHRVSLSRVGLAFDGSHKGVEGVDEFEIDILCFL